MHSCLAYLSIALVAGCAAAPEPKTVDTHAVECRREYRVGSNIPVLNCAVPMSEEDRQRMISDLQREVRPIPAPKGGGG